MVIFRDFFPNIRAHPRVDRMVDRQIIIIMFPLMFIYIVLKKQWKSVFNPSAVYSNEFINLIPKNGIHREVAPQEIYSIYWCE